MSRQCANQPDSFCYVCEEVVLKFKRRNITPPIQCAYEHYFGCKIGDQDKYWAPHICCQRCATVLLAWAKGSLKNISFMVPIVWRESTNHTTDCCFCLRSISGLNTKGRKKIQYPNVSSAIRLIVYTQEIPV